MQTLFSADFAKNIMRFETMLVRARCAYLHGRRPRERSARRRCGAQAVVNRAKEVVDVAEAKRAAFQEADADGDGVDADPHGRPRWEVNFHEVQVLRRLGAGSFGEVYEGRWNGLAVAVKQFSKNIADSDVLAEAVRREAAMMSQMRRARGRDDPCRGTAARPLEGAPHAVSSARAADARAARFS